MYIYIYSHTYTGSSALLSFTVLLISKLHVVTCLNRFTNRSCVSLYIFSFYHNQCAFASKKSLPLSCSIAPVYC